MSQQVRLPGRRRTECMRASQRTLLSPRGLSTCVRRPPGRGVAAAGAEAPMCLRCIFLYRLGARSRIVTTHFFYISYLSGKIDPIEMSKLMMQKRWGELVEPCSHICKEGWELVPRWSST